MFKIKIEEITTETCVRRADSVKVADKGNERAEVSVTCVCACGGWRAETITTKKEILSQTVDELDLVKVINAINNIGDK